MNGQKIIAAALFLGLGIISNQARAELTAKPAGVYFDIAKLAGHYRAVNCLKNDKPDPSSIPLFWLEISIQVEGNGALGIEDYDHGRKSRPAAYPQFYRINQGPLENRYRGGTETSTTEMYTSETGVYSYSKTMTCRYSACRRSESQEFLYLEGDALVRRSEFEDDTPGASLVKSKLECRYGRVAD